MTIGTYNQKSRIIIELHLYHITAICMVLVLAVIFLQEILIHF